MPFNLFAQQKVYTKSGSSVSITNEDIDIVFSDSDVRFYDLPGEESAALLSLLPTIVDLGFKISTELLEKRIKKFSAEYNKGQSYLNAGSQLVPHFDFIRKVTIENQEKTALRISFKARRIEKLKAFVYYVDMIELNYSSAKATGRANTFDYTFQIVPTFLLSSGEKKPLEIQPITMYSVGFGKEGGYTPAEKFRSEIIPLPDGARLTEVNLKIIETNPAKVQAEKVLTLWNENKDQLKTIINNYLPKEKPGESAPDQPTDVVVDPNAGDGNG